MAGEIGRGTAQVNFGAFPGASDASVSITGQTLIGLSAEVEAWIEPYATIDHTADEHMVETIRAFADRSSIVAGTGFTVRAFNTSEINEPDPNLALRTAAVGTRLYGIFTVGYAWKNNP
jgi:hypothetical protein